MILNGCDANSVTAKTRVLYSSFPALHKVGNVDFFLYCSNFESKLNMVISHIYFIQSTMSNTN